MSNFKDNQQCARRLRPVAHRAADARPEYDAAAAPAPGRFDPESRFLKNIYLIS